MNDRTSPDPRRAHVRALPAVVAALAGLLVAAGAALADPKAQVEPEVIDLGVIQEGGSFERYFELTNVGDGILILEDVKTSCGCTAAAVDGVVELKAGESQKIRVTFNSKNQDGQITKKVTVTTNDPEARHTAVSVKADVHKPVRWTSRYLSIDKVSSGTAWEETISLQADENLGMEIQEAIVLGGKQKHAPSKNFEVQVSEARGQEERVIYDFTVNLSQTAKPQRLSESLVVITNLESPRDTLRVPIRGEIVGRIRVSLNYAVLRIVDPGEESTRDVVLTSNEGEFQVTSADVASSPVQTEIISQHGGQQAVVRLSYVGGEAGENGVRQLRIETDDPEQSVIEIPVRYQTRATAAQQSNQVGTANVDK